jgi:phosphate transport system permease protein
MATEDSTASATIESFGQVSRTVGTVFQYLLLAATMFGIVALAVLLVYVANDAIRPLTADAGWHLVFLLTLVLPTLASGAYLYARNVDALKFGVGTLGLLFVTLLFSGGVGMVFVDLLDPLVWASYVVAVAVPTGLTVALQRYDRQVPFWGRLVAAAALYYLSLFGFPGFLGALVGVDQLFTSLAVLVQSLPIVLVDWMLLALTLGVFSAAVVANYAHSVTEDRRRALIAGGLALAGVFASAFLGPLAGVNSLPAVVLASVAVVPTVGYATGHPVARPEDRSGLLLVGAVVGGAFVGAAAVEALGFAGPQSWVNWGFLTSAHSGTAEEAGLYPAIGGSILLMVTVAALSFPLGVGAAVYLEEYAGESRLKRFIDVNISNLAGVPSVVYGLLGLGVFVTYLGQPAGTVLIGGATLALLILPIVIISAREAIRSVPEERRQASYGMGATRWQTVKNVILPEAFPGILTGTILALGRAIGETAPLIMIGAPNVVFSLPTELSAKVSAMPLQVYSWATVFASPPFYQKAVPAGVVVLVVVLLAMNSVAIVLRHRYQN